MITWGEKLPQAATYDPMWQWPHATFNQFTVMVRNHKPHDFVKWPQVREGWDWFNWSFSLLIFYFCWDANYYDKTTKLKTTVFHHWGDGKSCNTFRSHPNFKTKSRKVMLVYTRYPPPPPKINITHPRKGPFQREISSSNHWFSGDMLLSFQGSVYGMGSR